MLVRVSVKRAGTEAILTERNGTGDPADIAAVTEAL